MNGNSKYQKTINRHLNTIHKQQKRLENGKIYRKQASNFMDILLAQGRVTKKELSLYFKKRP